MNVLKKLAMCLTTCAALTSLPLPAFAAGDDFEYVVLDDGTVSVTSVDKTLAAAEIPAEIDGYTVTALGEGCFENHEALQTVVFPDTITTIGDYAFENCTALTSIEIPAGVTALGDFMFEGCTALTEIRVEEGNTAFCDDGGVLYTAGQGTLIRYPAAKADTAYTTAASCTTISPWAFTECSMLQKLEMPAVNAIGADAFFCAQSLQTVVMSDGLTELVGASFAYCVNLRKITLPTTLKTIGDKCFYFCASLPSVTLPDGLLQIGEEAFYGCVQLKELELPSTVKSIGNMGVGYSMNPDTKENMILEDFELKTIAGSRATSYAKENNIAYSASYNAGVLGKYVGIGVVVLLILGVVLYFFWYKKHKEQMEREKEREAAQAAKREARRARRAKK